MRKDRFKKRGMALGLAGVMLFSTLTGTTVNATWSDNPEEKPDAVRYGLWMGDSWYGEYRYDEETDTPMEDWLVSEDTAYSAEEVNIEDMYDYTNDIDIRAVNGTWKNAYYFSYVSYTKAEDGSIAETEEPKQITDASELVITYLGAELDNPEAAGSKATSVVIPATVKGSDGVTYEVAQIADNALKGNKTVKSVTVGNKVKEIGANAFQNATNLTTVKLGTNVVKIDKNAFAGCSKLNKVTASGSKITTISDAAFKGDKALTSIDISKSKIKSIGKNAFYGDKKLNSIKINGNSLTKVGKNAFKGIKKNATITISAKDKKTYDKVVKLIKKSGAKNVKYKFKKKK